MGEGSRRSPASSEGVVATTFPVIGDGGRQRNPAVPHHDSPGEERERPTAHACADRRGSLENKSCDSPFTAEQVFGGFSVKWLKTLGENACSYPERDLCSRRPSDSLGTPRVLLRLSTPVRFRMLPSPVSRNRRERYEPNDSFHPTRSLRGRRHAWCRRACGYRRR